MKRCIKESLSEIIIFLLVLSGCSTNILKTHLENLQKENSQINIKGWELIQKTKTEVGHFYSLKKQIGDTTFSLSFDYFKQNEDWDYKLGDFIKSFNTDNFYNEMALLNRDTLYYFRYKCLTIDNPETPLVYKNMDFITGKYYYMYKRGGFNWEQKEYFENNIDSLFKIKGNNLPELPDFGLQKNDTLILPEESLFPTL